MYENAKVKIRMFGCFEIIADGNAALPQLRQAKKTCQFLEYLILKRGAPVPHEELLDMLWSEKESRNPATALRTLLHRYRALVEESGLTELKNSVLTARGAYRWNPDLDCSIDVFELESLCQQAGVQTLPTQTRIDLYLSAMELYTGPLLGNGASESWVVPKSVYYHDLFLESVFALIELLKQTDAYETVVRVCRKAMDVDMFDERLHLELMLALVKTGKKQEALSQYYFTTGQQHAQLGLQPSDEVRAVYKQIVKADQAAESDIERIRAVLEAEDESAGAFVCDYEVFREIYQLQRRMIERYNSTMFLALLTVTCPDAERADNLLLDSIAKRALESARTSLRRGDTISRCSAMQYAILLPAVTYETGRQVLERVKEAFYEQSQTSTVTLSYKLRPLCVSKYAAQDETGRRHEADKHDA